MKTAALIHYPFALVLAAFVALSVASAALASSAADRSPVNLSSYGISPSAAKAAICVHEKLSASVGLVVAHRYWRPNIPTSKGCMQPRKILPPHELAAARSSFLHALSLCTNSRVTHDEGLWLSEVSDATSVLVASGIRDALTGQSLLERFNEGAHTCDPSQLKALRNPQKKEFAGAGAPRNPRAASSGVVQRPD